MFQIKQKLVNVFVYVFKHLTVLYTSQIDPQNSSIVANKKQDDV